MNDSDLALELRVLRGEIAALRAELRDRMPDAMTPEQRRAVEALGELLGPATFTTRELLATLAADIGARPACRAALEAVAGTAADAQRVGQALALIARRGGRAGAWRLCRPAGEAGRALFALERTA